jgi:ribosomal protein S18 acetylase RimI-like enzyme
VNPPESPLPVLNLPDGWTATPATLDHIDHLVRLLRAKEQAAVGRPSATGTTVQTELVGWGARPREHVVVWEPEPTPDQGPLQLGEHPARAWASVHDRAAGRCLVAVTVDPELDEGLADRLAAALFDWAAEQGRTIARSRGLAGTQLDSGAFAEDRRQQRWLEAAGFSRARTWWQMTREVTPDEGAPGAMPPPRPGVVVRRTRLGADGLPDLDDVRAVHDVLESSFADHFNSYQETFEEFVVRQRENPGHRWDHWWLAELDDGDSAGPDGSPGAGRRPAGAVIATTVPGGLSPEGDPQPAGSYIEYIGVLASARGRGVAKALLRAVIADAAQRGRDRVGLEVDADSPTRADALYGSLGWHTAYRTESWHRDILT